MPCKSLGNKVSTKSSYEISLIPLPQEPRLRKATASTCPYKVALNVFCGLSVFGALWVVLRCLREGTETPFVASKFACRQFWQPIARDVALCPVPRVSEGDVVRSITSLRFCVLKARALPGSSGVDAHDGVNLGRLS